MSDGAKRTQHLSRRLLSHYMMFGLLSIITLAASLVVIVAWSVDPARNQSLLPKLGETAQRITADFQFRGGAGVQSLMEDLGSSPELLFAGVISEDGVYLAHTNPELVGRKAARNFPAATSPGVIERVSYLREDKAGPREYWLPLRGQAAFGMLQAGVRTQRRQTWAGIVTQHAGSAAAFPILLLVLGGLKLNGVVRSSSAIEYQLSELAAAGPQQITQLRPVEVRGPASIGWNQLASQVTKQELIGSLESRLSTALSGFREEKYERVLNGLTDGVAATSEDGTITFANRAFAVLLNADPETLVGCSVKDLILEQMPDNEAMFADQILEPSRPGVIELHRSKNLSDGVLRLARSPLRSEHGNSLSQLWSLRDITQQKLVEYTRDQFVDTATHELRTPLTTIKACAETLELEDEIDLELQKKYLNTINMEATRLGRFVDEFLNISRMEAGSLAVSRHEVDLDRLLADVIEKVRPQMNQEQIDFQILMPAKLPKLSLDKDKISAALVNLLGNAAKYTPAAGRVTLQVEVGETDLRVHVEDTGIGIAADEVSKVFDKFFRSDDSRVQDITGTGLGLAFAQEVARLHGGKINVHSEIDHGSRFTFVLPLA